MDLWTLLFGCNDVCFIILTANLKQVLIFAYLKQYSQFRIVFDYSLSKIDESKFSCFDWTDCYPDAKETLNPNMPKRPSPLVFVDADDADYRETRRSHTCVIICYLSTEHQTFLWYS